ncbi:MAG: hypothetical protein ACKOYN_12960 [Planctomycetota bacterium]
METATEPSSGQHLESCVQGLRASVEAVRMDLRRPFRVERRAATRWAIPGNATMLTLGTVLGTVVDASELEGGPWWVAGVSEKALPRGTRVSVGFSEPSCRPATGLVERCNLRQDGRFRLAVRFDGITFA